MNIHKNARLTPYGQERIVRQVESGQTPKAVSEAAGVARGRFASGLSDIAAKAWQGCGIALPAPPAASTDAPGGRRGGRAATPSALDRQADRCRTGISPATVSRILRRLGLNRLAALEPAEPVRRYEREKPGELIHIDIKKLGRFDR